MTDRQLVIFSAFSARPSIVDLVGLLMCDAEVTSMGGTARVSVVVPDAWRVHCLAAEFMARRLSYGWKEHPGGGFWVRTSYSAALKTLTTPSFLDGHRLRLWYIAAGTIEEGAVILRLSNNQALARPALAPLGLDGTIERGPAIRIEGAGKIARLADLIGERPSAAPATAWPGQTDA
ncbi:hypothetical protein [Allorhizocola rhizosphaerae]|uniref:hypothetical protein n=1 Tax=Allorhizocola rhizosphaerae TaxID=1872709 RepID=UPI000E3C861A|nr:hypothetical protein [Allorhizocola rhizosphaerae]